MRLTIVTLVVLITTAAAAQPLPPGSVPERLSREWRLLCARLIAYACRHPEGKRAVSVRLHAIGRLLHRNARPTLTFARARLPRRPE
jgi:hypothetical protein